MTITSFTCCQQRTPVRNQTVAVGSLVTLNGGASSDPDGDPRTYRWSLTAVPVKRRGFTSPTTSTTTLVVDIVGHTSRS